ncbi:MAG: AbrB/MazE/SpoVT family DNA-binding domain-containing protein, partial [Candidatus Bathyarchaeia archaeon]
MVGIFKYVGFIILVGLDMSEIVKVDGKGRVVIPKNIREMADLKEGSYVNVMARGKSVLIEPLEPV